MVEEGLRHMAIEALAGEDGGLPGGHLVVLHCKELQSISQAQQVFPHAGRRWGALRKWALLACTLVDNHRIVERPYVVRDVGILRLARALLLGASSLIVPQGIGKHTDELHALGTSIDGAGGLG